MNRLRFSLSALLVAVAAVFCAALARPLGGWPSAAQATALAFMFFALLAVLFGKRTSKAFWGGFAALSWGWLGIGRITTTLPTESLSRAIAQIIYRGATKEEFFASLRLFPWLWLLLLGFVGGIVAVWLDASRKADGND